MLYDNDDIVSSQGMYNKKNSNDAGMDQYYGPENKMEIPCDTCDLMEQCAEKFMECSAFKSWTTNGEYDSLKVGKLLKKAAQIILYIQSLTQGVDNASIMCYNVYTRIVINSCILIIISSFWICTTINISIKLHDS